MRNPELIMSRPGPAGQSGMALVISLIMLTVMSIIAVHGMRVSMVEERIASNVQQLALAEQAAEAALRAGEANLAVGATLPLFNGTSGFYPQPALGDAPRWTTLDWSQPSASNSYSGFPAGWPASASYFVEQLELGISVSAKAPPGQCKKLGTCGAVEVTDFYRVVARGEAGGGQAVVVLETTYQRGTTGDGRASWRRLR